MHCNEWLQYRIHDRLVLYKEATNVNAQYENATICQETNENHET